MPTIETYRRRARLLLRWHREQDYSIGERVRQLERYRGLLDTEVLTLELSPELAQEIVASEAGYPGWAELESAVAGIAEAPELLSGPAGPALLKNVIPILLVRNVEACAAFFEQTLGFAIDFLHGLPPFYGSVSRDGVCLHIRYVEQPLFSQMAAREKSLICASIEVSNVQGLFEEFKARGVEFAQTLTEQAWGGTDFHVRDPDGNVLSFVTYGSD